MTVKNPRKTLALRTTRETTPWSCGHYAEGTISRMRTPEQSLIELRAPDRIDPAEGQKIPQESAPAADAAAHALHGVPATPVVSLDVAAALRAEGFDEIADVIATLASRIGSTPGSAADDPGLDHDAVTHSTNEGI